MTAERIWGENGTVTEPPAGKVEAGHDNVNFPKHDEQNWFMNLASKMLQQIERTGALEWDAVTPYSAGLIRTFSGTFYLSLTATTGNQPSTSPTQWRAVASSIYINAFSQVNGLQAALNAKATPQDITNAINNLIASAPGTLDSLNELAAALGDNPNFATDTAAALGAKASLNTNVTFATVTATSFNSTG